MLANLIQLQRRIRYSQVRSKYAEYADIIDKAVLGHKPQSEIRVLISTGGTKILEEDNGFITGRKWFATSSAW